MAADYILAVDCSMRCDFPDKHPAKFKKAGGGGSSASRPVPGYRLFADGPYLITTHSIVNRSWLLLSG